MAFVTNEEMQKSIKELQEQNLQLMKQLKTPEQKREEVWREFTHQVTAGLAENAYKIDLKTGEVKPAVDRGE